MQCHMHEREVSHPPFPKVTKSVLGGSPILFPKVRLSSETAMVPNPVSLSTKESERLYGQVDYHMRY